MTIWKFPLALAHSQILTVPSGTVFIHADTQDGALCLWAMVNAEAVQGPVEVVIVGTGQTVPEGIDPLNFVGTVLMDGGAFVWHVFVKP